jgi:hypothetical protein
LRKRQYGEDPSQDWEHVVVVRTIPCKLPSGEGSFACSGGELGRGEKSQDSLAAKDAAVNKRPRLILEDRREIVGPGYTLKRMGETRRKPVARYKWVRKEAMRGDAKQGEVQQGSYRNITEAGTSKVPDHIMKGAGRLPAPCWCLPGLTKTQCRRVQKLRAQEIKEGQQEAERDRWFNQERLMAISVKSWKEKRIEKEERGSVSSSGDEHDSTSDTGIVDVNMVFQLPDEFGY